MRNRGSRSDRQRWIRKNRKRGDKRKVAEAKDVRNKRTDDRDRQVAKRDRSIERRIASLEYRTQVLTTLLDYEVVDGVVVTRVRQNGEVLGTLDYPVFDVSDVHHILAQEQPFDAEKEEAKLAQHVARIKVKKQPCQLEILRNDVRRCRSAIDCKYRRMNEDTALPECRR